jgi:glutathione peroxidase
MTARGVRIRLTILAGVLGLTVPASAFSAPPVGEAPGAPVSSDSFYSLKTNTLAGQPADLGQYAGKVTLVVNVASQCGFTPQYKGLEALQEQLKGKGFSVLGFPSNDFGGQEPGSPEEIQTFCQKNYGVTFPLFGKLVTKAGPEQSPIYAYLGKTGNLPNWNFCKYLVGKDGKVIAFFPSKVTPESKELHDAIAAALAK